MIAIKKWSMWRNSFILFGLLMIASCKPINIDYDSQTNFSTYKTYNFYNNIQSGLNELNNRRMRRAIDHTMREKGFIKSNNPDVFINFYTKESKKPSYTSVGVSVGRRIGRNIGVGINSRIPIQNNKKNQHITFDIVDRQKDKLIWQAEMTAEIKEGGSVASRDAQYSRNISKLLRNFPPQKP